MDTMDADRLQRQVIGLLIDQLGDEGRQRVAAALPGLLWCEAGELDGEADESAAAWLAWVASRLRVR